MPRLNENEAKKLLKKYSTSELAYKKVLEHSLAVRKFALKLAKKTKADVEFVKIASLLHDIGRFKCPPGKKTIRHGIEGAKILRKLGFERYAKVAERHLGAGITKKDIKKQKLDLPLKDYVPKTIEEKIITHADNFVFGKRIGSFKEVLGRYEKELGKKYLARLRKLKKDVDSSRSK